MAKCPVCGWYLRQTGGECPFHGRSGRLARLWAWLGEAFAGPTITVTQTTPSRPMTDEEAAAFDAAFDTMGKAFDQMGDAFDLVRRNDG